MAKKLSSPAKALYIVFALALMFSMMPALAVTLSSSAGAVPNGATAYGSDFILHEAGNGTARWVWDNIVEPGPPNDYRSATHSAYLKAENQGDSAGVIVTWGCTMGEVTGLSYWYRNPVPNGGLGPVMGLFIDTTHDGQPDYRAVVDPCPGGNSVWTQWYEDFTSGHWDLYQITGGSWLGITWTAMESEVGADAKLVAVGVGYNYYWQGVDTCPGEALVDDITVNTRTWDLEPLQTTCVKSELFGGGLIGAGYPIQIEVYDYDANTEGTAVLEQSTTPPDGNTSTFDLAHAPKSVGTTSAYDLGAQLTVTGVAQVDGNGTVTVSETPPASYPVFPGTGCAHAEADMNPSVITLTTPTQLTVTSLNDPGNCTETAPGAGEYMYIFISGYSGAGTPINELLYILGTDTQETTTQDFASIIAEGIDATYSVGSNATALFISAENHVWATYDWHQADTVTVHAQLPGETGVDVELIEVNASTLEPDKDSGFFKGILYPVTTGDVDPDPATPTGLERHELDAEHCSDIQLKYPLDDPADEFALFDVDNLPPAISNMSPDPATNESQPTISVDIVDDKCQVREDSLRFFLNGTEYFNFLWDGTTLTWTPAATLTDGTYDVDLKFADCCWNWAQDGWTFDVESSPPMMIDAITGWGWYWGHPRGPQNLNLRDTIMVVFSEPLNPATVEPSDFRVNGIPPADVEYHDYDGDWPGECGDNQHAYGLVFLYLSTPLTTSATPTVVQVGVVEDLAGNACDKPYTWNCNGGYSLELPQTVTAQDGIAPAITVTARPEDPGYNETVTVTATSSEPLSEAYLFVGEGNPDDYNWDDCKPIGWDIFGPDVPCDYPGHVPSTEWDDRECSTCHSGCVHGVWMLMTQGATPTVWTASFTNEMVPNELWFVEVAAHDFTQWWVDMEAAGYWEDYECGDHEKRWKHEKWTQESLIFGAWDVDFRELCEGWNLISVPGDLVYSSPQALFNVRTNVGVTKVYYYQPPAFAGGVGTWQHTFLNPTTGVWGLLGGLTTIEPGKAYWVWVSPPYMELVLHTLEPDPLTPPPAYSLKAGWNMVGFTDIEDEGCNWAEEYFATLMRPDNPMSLWKYDACNRDWEGAHWVPYDDDWDEDRNMCPGWGYWLWVNYDVSYGPAGD